MRGPVGYNRVPGQDLQEETVMPILRHVALLVGLLLPAAAVANEDRLYDPSPPPGSAFVRAVSCYAAGAAVDVRVGTTALGKLKPTEASAYRVVAPGELKASFGTNSTTVKVEPGSFYTLVLRDGTGAAPLLTDQPSTNLSRAQVTLYNLTDAPSAALKLADGSAAVVDAVASGTASGRLVNAVTVDLGVWIGVKPGPTLPGRALQRGASYSVFLCPGADGARATWVENTTSTR